MAKKSCNPSFLSKEVREEAKELIQSSPKLIAFKNALYSKSQRLVFCSGLASTGKTKNALDAAVAQVNANMYEKLILIRPIVPQSTGYLKGDLSEKMKPYTHQASVYSQKSSGISLEEMIANETAEIWPSDFLQGNRFSNSFVIIDEAQQIPDTESFTVLSRVGQNSKLVVIGDCSKMQTRKTLYGHNLLDYAVKKFADKPYASVHRFNSKLDILGDEITRAIILEMLPDFADPADIED